MKPREIYMPSDNTTIYLYSKTDDNNCSISAVDGIAADETCVLYLGGSGIVDTGRAAKLAGIVAREILSDVANVPIYVLAYDAKIINSGSGVVSKTAMERQIQFDRYGQNMLKNPEGRQNIYITPDNADSVFRQKIYPLIKKYGRLIGDNLYLVADGNREQVLYTLDYNLKQKQSELDFSDSDISAIKNALHNNTVAYSTHFKPKYIDNLFNKILLPRITDQNGNKLPIDIAQKRIRKLNILAHCHGAYVATMLAEKMQKKMYELGYAKQDIDLIQSQLLVVALAPSCPLGKTKTQFISFMSAYDSVVERPNNWVSQYVQENRVCELKNINQSKNDPNWNLKTGFLDGKNGNVFYAKQRFVLDDIDSTKKISWNEHNSSHFESEKFTADGRLLADISRNIVISGIKNSLAQETDFIPLPPIEELILDGKNDSELSAVFKKLKQNGREFLKTVCEYAQEKLKKMMPEPSVVRHNDTSERL